MLLSKKIEKGIFFFLIYTIFAVAVVIVQFSKGGSNVLAVATANITRNSSLDTQNQNTSEYTLQNNDITTSDMPLAGGITTTKEYSSSTNISESAKTATPGENNIFNNQNVTGENTNEMAAVEATGEKKTGRWSQLFEKVASLTKRVKVERKKEEPIAVIPTEVKPPAFKYSDIENITNIEKSFNNAKNFLENNIISSFSQYKLLEDENGDRVTMAFCALTALAKKINTLATVIPGSFIKSNKRTFRTTPLLGGLRTTFETLTKATKAYDSQIAASSDIFTIMDNCELVDYLCVIHKSASAKRFFQKVAALDATKLTAPQAALVIELYAHLFERGISDYNNFATTAKICSELLEESITLNGDEVLIKDVTNNLNAFDIAKIGISLYSYGTAINDKNIMLTGQHIFGSYGKKATTNIEDAANIYALFARSNNFYPHFTLLDDGATPIYSFGASESLTFRRDSNGGGSTTFTISTNFPRGESQYIFFGGVKAFRSIFIYDVAFRSDPRFEVYNSSGYVYEKDSGLFLLKSRHRQNNEIVRLIYGQ